MKQNNDAVKKTLEPLIKVVLEEERKNFRSEVESWEAHEAKIRAEFETMAANYQDRLTHACDLIRQRFR
ncbi:MAG: hypothetical protein LLG04_09440 [Parachlamydia sp.]|nr:hypothetical protein [Parachlamydia sp.]